ncbi:glycosyltransferase [Acinetobacter baumannii]|nr:glycosyltransferase [Acinetobacter baumannii]MDC5410004.1 glycosyltransferase [Acinetobacter baumannii]
MLISVILPAYNAEKYIKEAIDSVLAQSLKDFEFIIINDGSIDKTEEIVLSYSDERIVYVKNHKNLGLIKTLNKGIGLAVGKYIIRMDADDICMPQRFERQINFLEKHLEYGVVGSCALIHGTKDLYIVPESDEDIKNYMFIDSPFIHPSVCIRARLLKENLYSEDFFRIEDYELWVRLAQKTKFYNIQETLLKYRVIEGSESHLLKKQIERKNEMMGRVLRILFEHNNIDLTDKELINYIYLLNRNNFSKIEYIYLNSAMKKIELNNKKIVETLSIRWLGSFALHKQNIFNNLYYLFFSKWTYWGGVRYFNKVLK